MATQASISCAHAAPACFPPSTRYLWVTIVYNLTYTVALYGLLLFYLGTHELLAPFKPLLKFALVKAVIFLSYWQGLFISIATGAGAIDTGGTVRAGRLLELEPRSEEVAQCRGVVPLGPARVPSVAAEDGTNLQSWLLCVEMLPAAIFMLFAFPWAEYVVAGGNISGGNITHAISIRRGVVVARVLPRFMVPSMVWPRQCLPDVPDPLRHSFASTLLQGCGDRHGASVCAGVPRLRALLGRHPQAGDTPQDSAHAHVCGRCRCSPGRGTCNHSLRSVIRVAGCWLSLVGRRRSTSASLFRAPFARSGARVCPAQPAWRQPAHEHGTGRGQHLDQGQQRGAASTRADG